MSTRYWKITSRQGSDLGIHPGDGPEDALDALQQDGQIPDAQIGTVDDYFFDQARPEDLLEAAARSPADDVGDMIRRARSELELSRVELGRWLGIPAQTVERDGRSNGKRCATIEKWESGDRRPGGQSMRKLQSIADAIRGARNDRGQIARSDLRSAVATRLDVDIGVDTE